MIKIFNFLLLFPNIYLVYLSKLGRDERFKEDNNLDLELLKKIHVNLQKKELLSKLLDNNTSEVIKLKIIENEINILNFISNSTESSYLSNIYSGGLLKDFNFTL